MLYYHQLLREAAPKGISRRTSYRHVCLAFHPYPQVIRCVFNRNQFGPPHGITHASTCSWIDHAASGLFHRTKSPLSDSVSLRLQGYNPLTSHGRITRRLIMQKARSHQAHHGRYSLVRSSLFARLMTHFLKISSVMGSAPTACKSIVSGSISLPFRGSFHLSLTVLVHYR